MRETVQSSPSPFVALVVLYTLPPTRLVCAPEDSRGKEAWELVPAGETTLVTKGAFTGGSGFFFLAKSSLVSFSPRAFLPVGIAV